MERGLGEVAMLASGRVAVVVDQAKCVVGVVSADGHGRVARGCPVCGRRDEGRVGGGDVGGRWVDGRWVDGGWLVGVSTEGGRWRLVNGG